MFLYSIITFERFFCDYNLQPLAVILSLTLYLLLMHSIIFFCGVRCHGVHLLKVLLLLCPYAYVLCFLLLNLCIFQQRILGSLDLKLVDVLFFVFGYPTERGGGGGKEFCMRAKCLSGAICSVALD